MTDNTLIEKLSWIECETHRCPHCDEKVADVSIGDEAAKSALRTVLEEIIHLNGDKPDPASKEYERWKANDLMAKMIAQDNNIKLGEDK